MMKKIMRRVYVWELPVRIFHWMTVVLVCILTITGIVMGDPPAILSSQDASSSKWFGNLRFIHFTAAWLFLFNLLFRLYWGFVGNKWARWYQFIPTNIGFIRDLFGVLRHDILLLHVKEKPAIGHNALAGLSYFGIFLAFAVIIITGFGLYAPMSGFWIAGLFSWVTPLFGDEFTVRVIHHVCMWVIILFVIIHVYLVLYHEWVEGHAEVSSMIGGWKFIEEDIFTEHKAAKEAEKEKKKTA